MIFQFTRNHKKSAKRPLLSGKKKMPARKTVKMEKALTKGVETRKKMKMIWMNRN